MQYIRISFLSFLIQFALVSVLWSQNKTDSLKQVINDTDRYEEQGEAYLLLIQEFQSPRQIDSMKFYVDLAAELVGQNSDDELKVRVLIKKTEVYDRIDPEIFKKTAENYLQIATDIDYKEGIAQGLKHLSDYDSDNGRYLESIQKLETANEVLSELVQGDTTNKYKLLIGQNRHNIAVKYYRLQQFEKSIELSMQNQKLANEIGDRGLLLRTYQMLASGFDAMAGFANESGSSIEAKQYQERSLDYAKKTLEIAKQMDNKRITGFAFSTLGNIYLEVNRLDSAEFYMKPAVEIAEEIGEMSSLGNRLSVMGLLYGAKGNTELSIESYQRARRIALEHNIPVLLSRVNLNLANLNQKNGNYTQAIFYGKEAIEVATQLKRNGDISKAYLALSRIYRDAGEYKSAYENHLQHLQYRDSVINQENLAEIEALQTKFETERKEQENLALAQQNEIQELQIQQKNTLLIWGLVSVVLFFITGYLFYRQSMLKQEHHVLEAEQRLRRIQMNPHFIFNVLGSIQSYIAQNKDTKESISFLGEFGTLIRNVLEYSRSDLITLAEEIETLNLYLEIQNKRLGEKFSFSIKLDEQLENNEFLIPPMIAQPFIENSIEHGFVGDQKLQRIEIYFFKEADNLKIKISDNGIGLSEKNSNSTKGNKKKSLSTTLTKERMELLSKINKKQFSFTIEENKNKAGTTVTCVIPLIEDY
jgi:tetratricopeptide (TPR) repeat protein